VAIDPAQITIQIGDQIVCRRGAASSYDESRAHDALAERQSEIRIVLNQGSKSVRFLTTDLTREYVRINADYST
jgi:glutamate N-acetyltransferase/amino-acid N-acetyltransferase